ncbi:MAG TPA: dicarboxylate/amino acid:cation symporter [Gemmatimonadales bacterium]|nr:dicarboxylate/amino acid:cation symporter [Gemmatimonadales bacterium]
MRRHVWMGIGLIAGLLVGLIAAGLAQRGHPGFADLVGTIRPIGSLFLNLLSMVVIPLVATALFAGIAKLGDLRTVGRLVVRTLAFFWATALAGIVLGFVVAAAVLPRAAVTPEQQVALRAAQGGDQGLIQRAAETIPSGAQFIVQLVPANPFKAAAEGNLLPVIVFVTIFGIAAASLPIEKRAPLTTIADATTEALIKIVHWVLLFAPIGIFALVAPIVTQFGWSLVRAMLWFILAVIIGVIAFIALVYLPSIALIARLAPGRFLRAALPSMLMGFSTTSSLATLPTMIEAADKDLQIPRPISGFVLPLGASLNRGGSAVFQAVAVVFIARLYGIPFGIGQLLAAGAAVFLASLTVAAVPSGSVISLFPAFQSAGLPIAGISILIGLDRIPDMFRTMTNVTGHLTSAVVVAAIEDRK